LASTPSAEPARFGLRGLKRNAAMRAEDGFSNIEPLVRWLAMRITGIMPESLRDDINNQISNAGDYLGLTPEEYVAMSILSGLAGALVGAGLVFGFDLPGIAGIGAAVGGAMLPYSQISGVATERLKNIGRGLPYVIDLMALSMSAGLDFPGAVRQVVEKSSNPTDPIVEEFTLMLQALNLGRTRKDALIELTKRAPVDVVREFVNSVVQAEERGNPVAEVLSIQAGVSRGRRSVRAEEQASKAGVALTGPLMLAFLAILILVMGPAMMSLTATMQ
jgi:tight adherence protein C